MPFASGGGGRAVQSRGGESRPADNRRAESSREGVYTPVDRWSILDRRGPIAGEIGTRPVERYELWSAWVTALDEYTCPVCMPLHGMTWPVGEGPEPPRHSSCRCVRVLYTVRMSR